MQRIGDAPWLRRSLIALAVTLSALFLLLPLLAIFAQALAEGVGPFIANVTDHFTLAAIGLTLFITLLTIPVNLVFGVMLAWLVTRFAFPGRRLLQTLIDIPFAISPVVAGLVYLLLYGRNGWIGGWLDAHDIQLMFAWPGMSVI